jgi:RNA polymerase sigma-70 factor (ECF subfamily)
MAPWNRRRADEGGVEDGIARLVNEHGAALLGYAIRLTGDRHAAEDVVQETLTRAWQRYDQLDAGKGSVRGWLLTVARNIVIDQARARAARPPEAGELNETTTAAPAELDHADAVVDLIAMGQLLDTLTEEHRRVLVELYYRGRTVSEAAQTLGVPAGTVKSRSYHALRALRARLDPAPAM